MDRRYFIRSFVGAGSVLALPQGLQALEAFSGVGRPAAPLQQVVPRYPLPRPVSLSGESIDIAVRRMNSDLGPGLSEVWTLNELSPAPTIRLRSGQNVRVRMENYLGDPTILHWHGLSLPSAMLGHPSHEIENERVFTYQFRVDARPGVYAYHASPDRRMGPQIFMGLEGIVIVEGDEERRLDLPRGEYDIELALKDVNIYNERGVEGTELLYTARGGIVAAGLLGNFAFVNGRIDPRVEVKRARYRLRLVNAANARIFHLGFGNGVPMTLIGNDGGLLPAPVRIERITLGPWERADVLVDFSGFQPGERLMLRSLPEEGSDMMAMDHDTHDMHAGHDMQAPGRDMPNAGQRGPSTGAMRMDQGGPGMASGHYHGQPTPAQGGAMDLLEVLIADSRPETARPLPERLSEVPTIPTDGATPRREFIFDSENHSVNGRSYDIRRPDTRIRVGQTEIWSLVNRTPNNPVPFPIHVHGTQFQILSRTGGRNRLMPWEAGLKDTVLLEPEERVDVAVRFRHPGTYVVEPSNAELRDRGAMFNVEVEG